MWKNKDVFGSPGHLMNVNATVPFSGSLNEVVGRSSRVSVQYTVGRCYGSNGAHAHMKWAAVYSMGIHPL